MISSKCVTERIGTNAYTDAAPAGTSTYVGKGYFGTNTDTSCGVANYTDAEVNSIQPLTNDTTMLKRRIDKLVTGGSTAGHLGTAWAWYLLSPKWNTVLQQAFPASSAGGTLQRPDGAELEGPAQAAQDRRADDGRRLQHQLLQGRGSQELRPDPDINCNSENGKSLAQATALCTAMKAPVNGGKIEVYTVGFQVSSAAKTFLTNCATDASHYYDATTEVALQAAFRDIALKIATLRLTN